MTILADEWPPDPEWTPELDWPDGEDADISADLAGDEV